MLAPDAVSDTLVLYTIEGADGVIVTVGRLLLVKTTSSVDVQVPLVVVQRSVALVPAGMPVTVEVADDGVVIVAVPLISVHRPVPVEGVFAASVKLPLLQLAWSARRRIATRPGGKRNREDERRFAHAPLRRWRANR